jgi:hypothetical protein
MARASPPGHPRDRPTDAEFPQDPRGVAQEDMVPVEPGREQLLTSRLDMPLPPIQWEKGAKQPTKPQRKKLTTALGGSPSDYEWSQADFEYNKWVARIRHENTRRQLILR